MDLALFQRQPQSRVTGVISIMLPLPLWLVLFTDGCYTFGPQGRNHFSVMFVHIPVTLISLPR
jgi:hypothetical protein